MHRFASLGRGSAQCCSMIQLCGTDLHLTLAISSNQMDVWQPEHTLDIQACMHASDNTHTHTHTHTTSRNRHTQTHSLGKGYNADWNKGADGLQWCSASAGKVAKICISVCMCVLKYVHIHLSEVVFTGLVSTPHPIPPHPPHTNISLSICQQNADLCAFVLACQRVFSLAGEQNVLPEVAARYFEILQRAINSTAVGTESSFK